MIDFKCGKCGAELSAPESQAGCLETCPACKSRTEVPLPWSPPEAITKATPAPLQGRPGFRPHPNGAIIEITLYILGGLALVTGLILILAAASMSSSGWGGGPLFITAVGVGIWGIFAVAFGAIIGLLRIIAGRT